MPQLPNITLKTIPFQFSQFQPIAYQQKVADKNILRHSLDKLEARRREANAMKDSYINSLKGVRDALNPSEYEWFDKEFSNINDRIGYMIESGDSGKAIEIVNTAGRDFANSTDISNKVRVESQRNKWLANAKSEGFDEITRFRMDKENPYYDNGTGNFEHNEYSKIIPLVDLAQKFISATPVQQSHNSNTTSTAKDNFIDFKSGKIVNTPLDEENNLNPNLSDASYSTTERNGYSKTITELKVEDMAKVYEAMKSDATVNASLHQEFSNMVWLNDWCDKTLNDPNASATDRQKAEHYKIIAEQALTTESGFYRSNSEDSFKKWSEDRFKKLFGAAAYRRISTDIDKVNSINWSITSGHRNSGNGNSNGNGSIEEDMPDGSGESYQARDNDTDYTPERITPGSDVKNVQGISK